LHLCELVKRTKSFGAFRDVWIILHGIWHSARVIFWVVVLLFLFMYVTAVVMTDQVMKHGHAETYDYSQSAWKLQPWTVHEYWGTVSKSLMSLFQIVTLDHWSSSLVRPLVRRHPTFLLIIVPFLLVCVMSMMNVIVSVFVESIIASATTNDEKRAREEFKVHLRIMDSLKQVFLEADVDSSGDLDKSEIKLAWGQQHVRDRVKCLGLNYKDLMTLFDVLDEEKTGNVACEKFFRGCTRMRGLAKASDLQHLSIDFGRYNDWCSDLVEDQILMNERLSNVLADIEGLDRDVLKGKDDVEDPVLMSRRVRFQKHGAQNFMNPDWADDDSDNWEAHEKMNLDRGISMKPPAYEMSECSESSLSHPPSDRGKQHVRKGRSGSSLHPIKEKFS
jgi:hypothetical protein